jgi:hypothetical protein
VPPIEEVEVIDAAAAAAAAAAVYLIAVCAHVCLPLLLLAV